MLDENTKVIMTDLRGKRDVGMEVLFSDNEDLKETVKVTMGSEEAIISVKDLYSFIFVIANAEQQEQLTPVKQTLVRKIQKLHKIRAKKDIKKGEFVVARCETNVPVEVWEGMKGMMGKRVLERKKTFGNIPIIGAK